MTNLNGKIERYYDKIDKFTMKEVFSVRKKLKFIEAIEI
jgi:hypothetical protein